MPLASRTMALAGIQLAAVQYGSGQYAKVDASCSDDTCGVEALVRRAAQKGASLVVTPEYGLAQKYLEPAPTVGENPGTGGKWSSSSLIHRFSKLSDSLNITLVINLQTSVSSAAGTRKHNSQVAFDPNGVVKAVHHKFELFDSEAKSLTPGQDVVVFDGPGGKVGLLICADLYGDLRLHQRLTRTLGASIVAVSSYWTAEGGHRWQQNFAKNWGVTVVGSNTTSGPGRGGGVFGPDGTALDLQTGSDPSLALASLPSKK